MRNWLLRTISAVRPAPLASVVGHLAGYHHRIVWRGPEGLFWLSPLNDLGRRLIVDHSYEPAMVDTLKQFLGPGKTFIDAAANEGYCSVIASRLAGENGHVILDLGANVVKLVQ